MSERSMSRRVFLRTAALGASLLAAACAPQVVEKVVEVEKEVTTVVEKEVETIIEKEVEKVVEVAAKTPEEILGPNLVPGSPDHPKGWRTTLPDLPPAVPVSPPVTITCTRRVDAQTRFADGDDLENNPWSRMIKELFGVEFKVSWTWATGDEANSKYNLAMASGDMPEYLETVPPTIYVQMVEAGLLEDITDAYDMYASPRWKDTWREYGELPWTWTRVDGRIYGIPRVEQLAHNDTCLWYREDWLEKLGLAVPTTLEELHDVALAFVQEDLGQGAPGTTIGLLANESYSNTWYGSLDPIWGAHGVIPNHWSEVGGDLILDAIRPETRECLELLHQWYRDGVFRPDFFTMTASNSMSDIAANLCGMHFTPNWGANLDSVMNDPEARWKFTGVPSHNGRKGKHTENNFRESPFCWAKGAQHVEQIFQITNWMMELNEDPWRRFHGWEGHQYNIVDDVYEPTGMGWMPWAPGPIGTRGSGMVDPTSSYRTIRYQLDEWGRIPAEERDALQDNFFDDPYGTAIASRESRLYLLEDNVNAKMTKFQRLPTATMVERGADLGTLQNETILGMIIGETPIANFDTFVDQWKRMGGDRVIEEVNEWWHSR